MRSLARLECLQRQGPPRGSLLLRGGCRGDRLDRPGEGDLQRLRRTLGEQPGRTCETQVADEEGGGRGGFAAKAVKANRDLDQCRSKSDLGLLVGFVAPDCAQIGAIGIGESVRPEGFDAIELPVENLSVHLIFTKSKEGGKPGSFRCTGDNPSQCGASPKFFPTGCVGCCGPRTPMPASRPSWPPWRAGCGRSRSPRPCRRALT